MEKDWIVAVTSWSYSEPESHGVMRHPTQLFYMSRLVEIEAKFGEKGEFRLEIEFGPKRPRYLTTLNGVSIHRMACLPVSAGTCDQCCHAY